MKLALLEVSYIDTLVLVEPELPIALVEAFIEFSLVNVSIRIMNLALPVEVVIFKLSRVFGDAVVLVPEFHLTVAINVVSLKFPKIMQVFECVLLVDIFSFIAIVLVIPQNLSEALHLLVYVQVAFVKNLELAESLLFVNLSNCLIFAEARCQHTITILVDVRALSPVYFTINEVSLISDAALAVSPEANTLPLVTAFSKFPLVVEFTLQCECFHFRVLPS